MKKFLKVTALTITFAMMTAYASFAVDVKVLDGSMAKAEAVKVSNEKLYLKQTWYGTSFELNKIQTQDTKKLAEVDKASIEQAYKEVTFQSSVAANVYVIDYKVKDYENCMALSFKDNSIVVFGTYNKLSQFKIHQLAVHELGHQVDFQLMNDAKWAEYKKLRGITDNSIYNNNSATYSNRPQEIFAEDFRMLFGGTTAKRIAHLNSNLKNPNEVKGLKEFFLSLQQK